MQFSLLTIAALLPLVLGSPVADPNTEASDAGPDYIPSVQVPNARIAGTADQVKGSYIVVYKKTATDDAIAKYEAGIGGKLGRARGPSARFNKVKNFRGYWLQADKAGIEKVAKDPLVDYVELDAVTSIPATNDTSAHVTREEILKKRDEQQNAQWGLARISNRNPGSTTYRYHSSSCAGTVIYILDTGIRTTHAEFRDGWRAHIGTHFISDSPYDYQGHGTHVAGTAAGKTYGVCRKATVVSVKVLGDTGSGTTSSLMQGLEWAVSDAARRGVWNRAVISMSIGGSYSQALNDLVNRIVWQGITVTVSAGNSNVDVSNQSPASAEQALTVAASDRNDNRASFSNFGNLADIYAPGVDIWSASIGSDNTYVSKSGTSMAAPHVAGVAAYVMTLFNLNNPAQVRGKLYDLATWNKISDAKGPNALLYNGW